MALKYFDSVGFSPANPPTHIESYNQWLNKGFHGEMKYLRAHAERKRSPQALLKGARSWIVCTSHYDSTEPLSQDLRPEMQHNNWGWVSRYARGPDYHEVISKKQYLLIQELKEMLPAQEFLNCVDTKAVLERDVAASAGLGWIGKNTCLIDQKRGSFFFISEILTTFEIEPDRPIVDHCGTCTRCLE